MPVSSEKSVQTVEINRSDMIESPIAIVFEALIEQLGSESQMPDGSPFPLKLEAWPGGRWFRDLGAGAGHFWGHVQVIKPPTLLEICGPLFMSYPAANFLQYRLAAEGSGTRLTFTHKSMGLIPKEHRDGMEMGWTHWLKRIREGAARRHAGR